LRITRGLWRCSISLLVVRDTSRRCRGGQSASEDGHRRFRVWLGGWLPGRLLPSWHRQSVKFSKAEQMISVAGIGLPEYRAIGVRCRWPNRSCVEVRPASFLTAIWKAQAQVLRRAVVAFAASFRGVELKLCKQFAVSHSHAVPKSVSGWIQENSRLAL
jgi:hypothetical protein